MIWLYGLVFNTKYFGIKTHIVAYTSNVGKFNIGHAKHKIFSYLTSALLKLQATDYHVRSFCLLNYWKKNQIDVVRPTLQ